MSAGGWRRLMRAPFPVIGLVVAVVGAIVVYRAVAPGAPFTCPATHPVGLWGRCYTSTCLNLFVSLIIGAGILYLLAYWSCSRLASENQEQCRKITGFVHALVFAILLMLMGLLCSTSPIP